MLCSDVAIDTWGTNTIITGNTIYDESSAYCHMDGYADSYEGISIEDGGGTGSGNYLFIAEKTITTATMGYRSWFK